MRITEHDAVKFVAGLAPWLAPIPSAFFVARSSITHLALPGYIAIVVAAIVETLGLATVHTTLRLWDWNRDKRKTDPTAPTLVGIALGVMYIITTLGLIVALEVWPGLATYAPIMFPFLAIVGTVNLALIASQDRREAALIAEKADRKAERQAKRQDARQASSVPVSNEASKIVNSDGLLDRMRQGRQTKRDARLDALLTFYLDNPAAGPSEAARAIGVSRQTIYAYVNELEQAGRLRRNGHSEAVQPAGQA